MFCSLCFPWLKAEPSLQKRSCTDTPQQIHFYISRFFCFSTYRPICLYFSDACQVQHFIIAFSNLLGYISNGMLSLDVIDTLNKCSGYNHVRGSCKQIPAWWVQNWTQDQLTSMTQTWGSTPSSSTEILACLITHSWMASVMWGTTGNRFIG